MRKTLAVIAITLCFFGAMLVTQLAIPAIDGQTVLTAEAQGPPAERSLCTRDDGKTIIVPSQVAEQLDGKGGWTCVPFQP